MNTRASTQASAESPARPPSPWRQLTGYQWLVLAVAWLGWVFDSMDALIYAQVMTPALKDLLGARGTPENIAWYGGIIFSIFMLGWAVGGVVFGVLADYLGRARTLVITILIYAVFTALAGLSHSWWQLGVYRFLTALGIGGEWAAGAALVAEVWPESLRVKGAGLLQSAWGAGFFVAAGLNLLLSNYSWRVMFFAGIVPAVVALLIRLRVHEPERWQEARRAAAGQPRRLTLAELFTPQVLPDTLVGTALAFVAVFGLWGATNWTPSLIHELLRPQGLEPAAMARQVSYAVMSLNVGAIAGYLLVPLIAEWWNRRGAFLLMMVGSAISLPAAFLLPSTYAHVLLALPALGFFSNGIFSGFPVYLPEIFPTRIRATGAGFCFNAGRILAAAGPFLTGWLVLQLGTFARAASTIALVYVAGLLVLVFARETKGQAIR
ncbi:MAG: MFS transporter [Acidobacteriia bacterium]|nr:MFS transporter [Terriglobia bacterium]